MDDAALQTIYRSVMIAELTNARGVARIFEWGDERRRREKRGAEGAEGVGCGARRRKGSGEGAVSPPQKILIL